MKPEPLEGAELLTIMNRPCFKRERVKAAAEFLIKDIKDYLYLVKNNKQVISFEYMKQMVKNAFRDPFKDKNETTKWTKLRRASGLLEYVCEHGVGHPDYESAKEVAKSVTDKKEYMKNPEKHNSAWRVHGCDRCCGREDFPGKKKETNP